jgi:two-component system, LytTR family, sensor kinase
VRTVPVGLRFPGASLQIQAVDSRFPLRFWPLQLAGWLAFGVAMGLSRVTSYPLDYMLATKTVLAALGFVVSLGLRAFYQRLLQHERPLVLVIVVLVVASYAAAFPWTAVYNLVDAQLLTALTGRVVRRVSMTGGALYHAFVLVAWSVLYLGVRQYAELQEGRERVLRAEALATAGRLSALRYQLNPHFLYNTLNAISTLVIDQRTDDATRMISRLSDLLRVTLNDQTPDEVPVSSEVAVLRQYLEIEQVRFGDRLSVIVSIAPDAEPMLVPTLILQPLVENAIRHGISNREGGGTVEVGATVVKNILHLFVDDDGPGLANRPPNYSNGTANAHAGQPEDASVTNGIGLANCRERLNALYGKRQRMVIQESPRGGVRVTIELPARASSTRGEQAV